jgi:hypothetical protein
MNYHRHQHLSLKHPIGVERYRQQWCHRLSLGVVTASNLVSAAYWSTPAQAQSSQSPDYCPVPIAETRQKDSLRLAAQKGDRNSQQQYNDLVRKHNNYLQQCRQRSWLKNQAIWIRLYPCDTRPGALEEIFDHMVNKGYNQVYVATFYAGQVLLPKSDNPTVWPSVLNQRGAEKNDLLATAIQKGRERGLKVYAWMYGLNFGPNYGVTPEGQSALGVNGRGETTLFAGEEGFQKSIDGASGSVLFVDPYSDKAVQDYQRLVQAVARRRPDGMLVDYIRFPRGQGPQSIASQVRDLWIYNPESRQTLVALAKNSKGEALIDRFLDNGNITVKDLKEIDQLFPDELFPLWQGRTPLEAESTMAYEDKLPWIQWDLWQLSLAHASDGVVKFLQKAVEPIQKQQIKAGAVFFPEANQPVGQRGFDSRLQAWDRFPSKIEWHPMSYAICNQPNCIVEQVRRVLNFAPANTEIVPALAGVWGKPIEGRPPLEIQMDGIRRNFPQIKGISHFAFSWQEPELDYYRSSCQVKF